MQFKPRPYQAKAIEWILDRPYCGLFLDMGLGKTVSTLTAVRELILDYLEVRKVLVIAPKRVALNTWPEELEKWDHLKDLTHSIVMGSAKERKEAIEAEADIYITSRDFVTWLVDEYRNTWPFDMLVIDELSSFKSAQAKRFKNLRKVRPYFSRIVGLTGTPAPNGYTDLWSQIFLLDGGERLGKTLTIFRRDYCQTIVRPSFTEYKVSEPGKLAIDDKIADICISMKSEDHLDLPDITYIDRKIPLSPDEKRAYDKMERDAVLDLDQNKAIMAVNAGVVANKLLQIANGVIYDEDGSHHFIHDQKLDELEQIVEEANGDPILVFYSFKSDLERLNDRFPSARMLDTKEDLKDWNDGKIKLLLAHPASAGHGLNLQAGGHIIVWFGLNWSLELYQQANARLHRQGQTKPVLVYHLIAKDTIDERVLDVLSKKDKDQSSLMDHVKALIEEYTEGV